MADAIGRRECRTNTRVTAIEQREVDAVLHRVRQCDTENLGLNEYLQRRHIHLNDDSVDRRDHFGIVLHEQCVALGEFIARSAADGNRTGDGVLADLLGQQRSQQFAKFTRADVHRLVKLRHDLAISQLDPSEFGLRSNVDEVHLPFVNEATRFENRLQRALDRHVLQVECHAALHVGTRQNVHARQLSQHVQHLREFRIVNLQRELLVGETSFAVNALFALNDFDRALATVGAIRLGRVRAWGWWLDARHRCWDEVRRRVELADDCLRPCVLQFFEQLRRAIQFRQLAIDLRLSQLVEPTLHSCQFRFDLLGCCLAGSARVARRLKLHM